MKKLPILLLSCALMQSASASIEVCDGPECTNTVIDNPNRDLKLFHSKTPYINTMRFIPDQFEQDMRTLIECPGGWGDASLGVDYIIYERMFSKEFLLGLYHEMKWIEVHYKNDFIDSAVKRNVGDYKDGDYANYHRVSMVYWLTFIREEDYKHLPNLVKFKAWIKLLRASLNRQLYEAGEPFEVGSIEEQYIFYDRGGKFEPHLDTQCNPLRNCPVGKEHHYPRLMTYLLFLNPDWQESDGGVYKTYWNWPKLDLKEVVKPTLGKAIIVRADKVYHSGEMVNTEKRAITLFINVKPATQKIPEGGAAPPKTTQQNTHTEQEKKNSKEDL